MRGCRGVVCVSEDERDGTFGSIYAIGSSKLFARGVAFTKCDGTVIWAMDARVEVLDCNFTENVGDSTAAAIASYYSCTPYSSPADDEDLHVLSITGSRFERNAAANGFAVRSYVEELAVDCSCAVD
jgi:hypothetical protein